jgi:hypothetical protein
MKTTIQSTLFFLGVGLLIASCFERFDSSMRMWLVLVAVATEGSLAQYLVREQVKEAPRQPFWENILPATLPLLVLVACLIRLFGAFGAPIFS